MLSRWDEDIGDKSASLPVWVRTLLCFLSGKIGFLILINHGASLKWNKTECNAHQGVWQNTICFLVIGKQDLGGIIYPDVIKHPVVFLTDWKHITRTDRAVEKCASLIPHQIWKIKYLNDKYKLISRPPCECFASLWLQKQLSLNSPGSNHGGIFLLCFWLFSNYDVHVS